MFRRSRRFKTIAALLAGGTVALAVACGGGDDPTNTPTATTQAGTTPTATGPTATSQPGTTPTVAPTAGTTPTAVATVDPGQAVPPPDVTTPNDTAVIAVFDVLDQNGRNQAQSPEFVHYWGIAETLFLRDGDDSTPWLATEYVIAPDLSGATITIRDGVQFQHDFGELTAADVAWSMNDANAATNPQSIHGQAGDFNGLWGEWTAVDENTIEFTFTSYDATWRDDFLNQSGQSFSVFSKRAFDEMGEDFVRDTIVGTGPFTVESWDRDVQATLVSRYADGGQHYLPELTPKTNRIQFIEAPDPSARANLIRTGQVDAATLEPREAAPLVAGGFGTTGTQAWIQLGVFFAGNLWETVSAVDGSPLQNLTYNADLAWIGNPFRTQDPDDMEQARMVRQALAQSIDRDLIVEQLLAGQGQPVHVTYYSMTHPRWSSDYEYAYDPEGSMQILSGLTPDYYRDGGVSGALNGNSFEVSIQAGPELGGGQGLTGEVVDAVAGFWAQLGLNTYSLKGAYQTFRPQVVGRTATSPWITSCDKGRESNPWHFPKGLVQTSLSRGGFSCSFESPDILALYRRMAQAPDQAAALQASDEYLEYVYHWNLQPGVVAVPDDVYFNPKKIAEWPMPKSATSNLDGLWNLTLVQ